MPQELGQLRRLRFLNLSKNLFEGSVPPALGRCTQLSHVNLHANHLQGELPPEIGSLKDLVYLNLVDNYLSGEIPPFLANLSSIRSLALAYNAFSGHIPSFVAHLPHLSSVSFEFNYLSGAIPPSFWNISNLINLSLAGNALTGTLPPNTFDNLPRLQTFFFQANQLHGPIPASLGNASDLLSIQLRTNFFSGTVPPEVGELKHLQNLRISSNFLQANGSIGWEFMTALSNCSQLHDLTLASNMLSGELPVSISNLSTSLLILALEYNKISGSIPEGIGNLVNLQALDLSNNFFTGTLPSSLGMLTSLHGFTVANNTLSGQIPLVIGNLTELNYLILLSNNFSGRIPSTLGNLTKLLELAMVNNSFIGPVPNEIFNIRTLSIMLDLSYNKLEGSIPQEIGNLKNLVELHLESNMFSGEIPATLGDCQLLQYLYMDNNFFKGGIPTALSQMKGLQILDLSTNNFSGQIPKFLGNLSALQYLNLSLNNFSGEVPTSGVFANDSAISIQGNDELCGGIYNLHLPKCSSEPSKKRRRRFPVILTVIPLAATLGILVLLCLFLTRHKKRSTDNLSGESMQGHPIISYSQLVKATDGFSTTNLLGTGTFGSVYKGTLDCRSGENANLVAVKVLKLQISGAVKSFGAECESMRNLRHRNLLKIISSCSGIDFKGNDFKAIVFDFMPNGSLEHWLHPGANNQIEQRQLNIQQRVNILLDVAYALDYLHFHGVAQIVHCDLKPSNVLLDADMVAHVGDFGLAKIHAEGCSSFQPSTGSMGFRGTIGYAPPEYGAGNMVSTHGDIYSYGILVLEMITGRRPTDDTFEQGFSLRKYVEMALNNQVMDIVDAELVTEPENVPAISMDGPLERMSSLISLLKLGLLCSKEMPLSRMSTKDIIKELLAIKRART